MAATTEITRGARFIFATLTADSTLAGLFTALGQPVQIYSEEAPQGTQGVYIIYHNQNEGLDVNNASGDRIMQNQLWLVKALKETKDFADLEPFAAQIDALLKKASGPVAEGQVLSSTRQRGFKMTEKTEGRTILHLGGFYRMFVQ